MVRLDNRYSVKILITLVIIAVFLLFTAITVQADTRSVQENISENPFNIRALRLAIEDLSETFPSQYKDGQQYLNRLGEIERGFFRILYLSDTNEIKQQTELLRGEFEQLQRQALIANPLVSGQPIVYVVRKQYKEDHHNSATMFQTGEINTDSYTGGGALKMIDLAQGGKVRTILDVGVGGDEKQSGIVRDPDIYFSGDKIIFSMRRNIEDDYHIYEINPDGTGLRQLTFGGGLTDIDPVYMPDDSIIFSSTREPKFCMCNRHIMANLHRMDSDGGNIYQIGKSTLHEAHASLLTDGRIIYDRWEYVDRNFGDAQGLWTVNPDGTNHSIYFGNNTLSPGGVIDARAIKGTEQIICTLTSCHDRPWGAIAIIDRRLGVDDAKPVVRLWPESAYDLIGGVGGTKPVPLRYRKRYAFDNMLFIFPKYEDPYPLSDKYFLCSRIVSNNPGEKPGVFLQRANYVTGIYLLDVFGNEILLHSEKAGCYDPMPLKSKERPPIIPTRRNFDNSQGYLYVADVYKGTHMMGVKRGDVKWLRVVESPEKRFWNNREWEGQGIQCPGMNWTSFENKRILGTVPVEEDGSAYFAVDSDKFIYFQLLDANGMMIQSMRSGTMVQSDETIGCTGCHENRRSAAQVFKKSPMAIQRQPSRLNGWYGTPRKFNYITEVQPVFDKYCVRCHDYGKKAGKKLNLAADRTTFFNTSYTELWRKKYINSIGAGPAQIQQAYSWGSHSSKLVQVILAGHKGIKLDKESFDRIVTWIDINGPYYPYYASAYPENLAGRSPLDSSQIQRLSDLTQVNLGKLNHHARNNGPQVSYDRPTLSPCLSIFTDHNDPNYIEAVSIIEAGKDMLSKRPRADMAGFEPCEIDQQREITYMSFRQAELERRENLRRKYGFNAK